MEPTVEPAAVLEKCPFVVSPYSFFLSETLSTKYTLGRLLRHDRHSDIFSLEHYPPGTKDPVQTYYMIEARRFNLDTSSGLSVKERKYRLRCIKRLKSRQLWTSIKRDKRVAFVVYETNKRLPMMDDLFKTSDGIITNNSPSSESCLDVSDAEAYADPEKRKSDGGLTHQEDCVSDHEEASEHGEMKQKAVVIDVLTMRWNQVAGFLMRFGKEARLLCSNFIAAVAPTLVLFLIVWALTRHLLYFLVTQDFITSLRIKSRWLVFKEGAGD
ncbi:hypothetical protein LX36DRAFT_664004 [Colletotrichum falcatum]|nr:hypothetical protein LX36DRAFT_664004 [Colletotrichum falcatum]